MHTRTSKKLTHAGALHALHAALDKATALGVPQNISIVDDGGNLLAFLRMDDAKMMSNSCSLNTSSFQACHSLKSA
mgnify:CR=1 FL=1